MGVALAMFKVAVYGCSFGDVQSCGLGGWVQFRLCSEVWHKGMGVAFAMFKVAV